MWHNIVPQTDTVLLGITAMLARSPFATLGALIVAVLALCSTWVEILKTREIEARWSQDRAEAIRAIRLHR